MFYHFLRKLAATVKVSALKWQMANAMFPVVQKYVLLVKMKVRSSVCSLRGLR